MFKFSTEEELKQFIAENVFTSTRSSKYLGITRQGFAKQVAYGRIKPISERLFWKKDLDLYRATVKKGRPRKVQPETKA